MVWPRSLKKSRNDCRMLAVVQRIERSFYPSAAKLPTVFTARGRKRKARDHRRTQTRSRLEDGPSPQPGREPVPRFGAQPFFFAAGGAPTGGSFSPLEAARGGAAGRGW